MMELGGRERDTKDSREEGEEGNTKTKWEMVVNMIQMIFQEVELPEEAAWKAVVLIPNG